MAPLCGVCRRDSSKYSCPDCQLKYCSLACFKDHRPACRSASSTDVARSSSLRLPDQAADVPLKPLSSLRWPFVPEAPSFQDPLSGNDPQPLKLSQFEAIATSNAVRDALASNERLHGLLRVLDSMSPNERNARMRHLLGLGDAGQLDPNKLTETEKEDAESFSIFVAVIQDCISGVDQDGEKYDGLQWAS
ncbi:uncharacterized protein EI90DRAFT_2975601 [Cantharellus anzutake]|uniref:uncharacterized protein n=1 Tax=Cantharellus anzutake TaxID=1750568 RepID=UPI001903B209|nr:uncharacterized protein EI90DRAFT_2975601 [Cantharellus anzutake]KAF8326543.1 hypothetical protein EI90DRAFT_2975601 [Cantharellus anzutake]